MSYIMRIRIRNLVNSIMNIELTSWWGAAARLPALAVSLNAYRPPRANSFTSILRLDMASDITYRLKVKLYQHVIY